MKLDQLFSTLQREIPKTTAVAVIVLAAATIGAIAWVQVRRQPVPSRENLQAQWVVLADRVHELKAMGLHGEALRVANGSLKLAETTYGPSHPATAEALNELAQLMVEFSQFDNVDAMYRRALSIQTRATGSETAGRLAAG